MESTVEPKPKPRAMSDLGPRRSMDMRRHTAPPVAAKPAAAPEPAPRPAPRQAAFAPKPAARPVTPAPRAVPRPTAHARRAEPVEAPAPLEVDTQPVEAAAPRASAWKIVLQFIIGLLVIAGVAFAIVALYVKYYQ